MAHCKAAARRHGEEMAGERSRTSPRSPQVFCRPPVGMQRSSRGSLGGISAHGVDNEEMCSKVSPKMTDWRQRFAIHGTTGLRGLLTH